MRFEGETLDDCMRTMRSQHRQALRCIFRIGAKDSTTRRLRRTRVPMMWMMYTAEQRHLGVSSSRLVYMISGQSAGFDIWQNTPNLALLVV